MLVQIISILSIFALFETAMSRTRYGRCPSEALFVQAELSEASTILSMQGLYHSGTS